MKDIKQKNKMLSRKLSMRVKLLFQKFNLLSFYSSPMNRDVDSSQKEASPAERKKREWSLADLTMAVVVILIFLSIAIYFIVEYFPKEIITIVDIPAQKINMNISP